MDGNCARRHKSAFQATRLSGWEALGGACWWTSRRWGGRPDPIRRFMSAPLTKSGPSSPPRPGPWRPDSTPARSASIPPGPVRSLPGRRFEKIEMQFLSDVFIRCPRAGTAIPRTRPQGHGPCPVRHRQTGRMGLEYREVLSRPVEDGSPISSAFRNPDRPGAAARSSSRAMWDLAISVAARPSTP